MRACCVLSVKKKSVERASPVLTYQGIRSPRLSIPIDYCVLMSTVQYITMATRHYDHHYTQVDRLPGCWKSYVPNASPPRVLYRHADRQETRADKNHYGVGGVQVERDDINRILVEDLGSVAGGVAIQTATPPHGEYFSP